eukprot:CAMPEP_0181288776 /NCGR_PEP_ID=MMETSP1101-20121128/524_1 /TAXON_ID=46948 /ORGANISM="Rhodomonas abbreviata, Strain Caron Lab Isolate" /LENGTH=896 /DNA_ID=CAMNT_0023392943 /DNA_START=287 /DNA_END=2977 /DNA_ORIENTATION=+
MPAIFVNLNKMFIGKCFNCLILVLALATTATHARWTSTSYSVMTGSDSTYPAPSSVGSVDLPDTLRTRYKQPESYHPNLRFWFTPDVFEEDNTADGAAVSTWRNVANICYKGHTSSECTTSMKESGDNMAVEALVQSTTNRQPVFKTNTLNGRGVVRFSRTGTNGTIGDFLQMETTSASGTPGFSTNPFTSNSNSYTIFLVARTRQSDSDTGDHGILNLALGTADTTEKGLRLYKPSVTCKRGSGLSSLSCTGTACSRCNQGFYHSLGQLNVDFGSGPTTDDNSCNATCTAAGGCDLTSLPAACLSAFGPTGVQNLQDPELWHIITLKASGGEFQGFIDGFHSSSQPPLYVTGEAAAAVEQFRLGVMDTGDGSAPSYGNVDIAEILIYDDALTTQEMDRIGNYLAIKFDLEYFRLDADVGSATRSVAISKGCGCPSAPWHTPFCNTSLGPYCASGAALASGTCSSSNMGLKVVTGESFLSLSPGTGGKGPTTGNQFKIQGYYVLPTDVNVNGDSGILGANSTNNVVQIGTEGATDLDTAVTTKYLAVSVGRVPSDCRSPRSEVPCLPADFSEKFATDCRIRSTASSGTNDATTLCANWVAPSPVPEIICTAPAGIGEGLDIIIYWHGVATVLSNWYHYEPPVIHSLTPNRVNYKGGSTVTLNGKNFGTQSKWTATTHGGFQTANVQKAEIIIESRRPTKCRKTTWVSDQQLLCEVPPMPMVRQGINAQQRTLQVKVVVQAVNQRNQRTTSSTLVYTDVPTFYTCDNDKISNQAMQRQCFECCRSACIVDEFSQGGAKKGYTYQFCDKSCYQYCGYVSGRTRRRMAVRRLLQSRHDARAAMLFWGAEEPVPERGAKSFSRSAALARRNRRDDSVPVKIPGPASDPKDDEPESLAAAS